MRKDVTICFRTNSVLRDSLKKVAMRERRTVSRVIENILMDHVRSIQGDMDEDRRRFPRTPLAVPAALEGAGRSGKILLMGVIENVSLSGVCVQVPRQRGEELIEANDLRDFELMFTLPENRTPLKLSCESVRIFDDGDAYGVGAFFKSPDFSQYQELQQFLM